MRHRIKGVKLSRDTEQRKSLFKNLLTALFEHGEIQTTEAKAKAIKGIADRLIGKAQTNTLPVRRLMGRFFGNRKTVNLLIDEVAPAMKDRKSGYTRIVRLGKRMGDDSMMVKMELVTKPVRTPKVKAEVVKPVEKPAAKPAKKAAKPVETPES